MGKNQLQLNFNGRKHTTTPKNYNHKQKKITFGFFGTCGHHILDYFCSFQVYFIIFRLKQVYLKRNSNKKLQT